MKRCKWHKWRSTHDITGDYTTLIVRYTLTNNADKTVVTDGVTVAKFSDGSIVSVQGGLDNDHTLVSEWRRSRANQGYVCRVAGAKITGHFRE